jgi:thymidylate synthase (FAD)
MHNEEGFVVLDGFLADDLSVVNSARVSFGKRKEKLDESDKGLIKFLMRERHGTPFEHNMFRFHVRCPIFVAREWFRHRVGSFNEYSGRYSELEYSAYVPELSDWRAQTGKPGAYTFESVPQQTALEAERIVGEAYDAAFSAYNKLLSIGVAKELARIVVPVGTHTEFYWTVNARSLMNFLSLRTHDTAQLEIRRYAASVEESFASVMPVTHAAWVDSGRVAP